MSLSRSDSKKIIKDLKFENESAARQRRSELNIHSCRMRLFGNCANASALF